MGRARRKTKRYQRQTEEGRPQYYVIPQYNPDTGFQPQQPESSLEFHTAGPSVVEPQAPDTTTINQAAVDSINPAGEHSAADGGQLEPAPVQTNVEEDPPEPAHGRDQLGPSNVKDASSVEVYFSFIYNGIVLKIGCAHKIIRDQTTVDLQQLI